MTELFEFLKQSHDSASALAAVSGVVVAALAFFVSVCSLAVSVIALRRQHRHNVLSVSPLPEVTVADYLDSVRVRLRNNGSGPMTLCERFRFWSKRNFSE